MMIAGTASKVVVGEMVIEREFRTWLEAELA